MARVSVPGLLRARRWPQGIRCPQRSAGAGACTPAPGLRASSRCLNAGGFQRLDRHGVPKSRLPFGNGSTAPGSSARNATCAQLTVPGRQGGHGLANAGRPAPDLRSGAESTHRSRPRIPLRSCSAGWPFSCLSGSRPPPTTPSPAQDSPLGLGALAALCLRLWEKKTGSAGRGGWASGISYGCLVGGLGRVLRNQPWRAASRRLAQAAGWAPAGLAASGRSALRARALPRPRRPPARRRRMGASPGLVLPGVWSPLGHYNHLASYLAIAALLLWRWSAAKGAGARSGRSFTPSSSRSSRSEPRLADAAVLAACLQAAFPDPCAQKRAHSRLWRLRGALLNPKPMTRPQALHPTKPPTASCRFHGRGIAVCCGLGKAEASSGRKRGLLAEPEETPVEILEPPAPHNMFLHQAADGGLAGLRHSSLCSDARRRAGDPHAGGGAACWIAGLIAGWPCSRRWDAQPHPSTAGERVPATLAINAPLPRRTPRRRRKGGFVLGTASGCARAAVPAAFAASGWRSGKPESD